MSCDSYVTLSNGAVGWYAVCDCGSSWLYSHVFFVWMATGGLDRNNTRRYVDVTKLSVIQSNMLSFTSGTYFFFTGYDYKSAFMGGGGW